MTTDIENLSAYAASAVEQPKNSRESVIKATLVFLMSYLILFIGMSLSPNVYDEGIILTGAMRVVAGQMPHQDFYANYGPGQFYLIAGLFKLFGQSVLVERLYDLFLRALVVALVYLIASSYCRRSIAACTAIVTVLWFFSLNEIGGSAVIPVSLLSLVASILVLPVFLHPISAKRMLGVGAVAGLAGLFRYDTGLALLGVAACAVAIAICLRMSGTLNRLKNFASTFWPCLPGFAAVTLPALLYYLSRAPFHPFVYDIILYPSKYYHRSRNLPFPRIDLKGLDNIAVYLPIAIVGIAMYVVVARRLQARRSGASGLQNMAAEQKWHGFLITFGLIALVMYFKGIVRVSPVHMYLSILPSLLLIAVLYQHRRTLPRRIGISIAVLMYLSVSAGVLSALREIRVLHKVHSSLPESIVADASRTSPEIRAIWCKDKNPLTEGICFLPSDDRIRTIEFIESHTKPDQYLFVGLPKHDRIFANDNLIYFATQRLPATKWSHLDPNLQNTYDIQTQMVNEFERNVPPYIVLDSEFKSMNEPNDSSRSSGVTLLDDYIHSKYQHVESFGDFSIWQRIHTP
ncbi:MAG TPA: hypothetical protein VGH07_03595 [Chthoniobacterales bacterium]